jgi:probable HAF family extracellular repeat protein
MMFIGARRFGLVWDARGRAVLSVAVLVLIGALTAQTQARPAKHYPYRLIDPGTFGGPSSYVDLPGVPITSNGTVLGTADTTIRDRDLPVSDCAPFCDGYVQHSFAWRKGRLVDLGALPPAAHNNSAISDLNGHGVGVGASENGRIDPLTGRPSIEATVFKHGRVIGLGTLGGHESFAAFINSRGQVTGNSSTSTRDPFPSEQQCCYFPWVDEIRGFVWRDGVMHDLGTLGGPDALSYIQNQRGQIAGFSDTNWRLHAATGAPTIDPFLWQHGHMTDLGSLGGTLGGVNWLNDRGEVVGQSDLRGDKTFHPYLWNGRRMIDLGTLGGHYGTANYVNDRGDVAGWATTTGDQSVHGFFWDHGKMTDLPPVGGAAFATAESVNDREEVVGVLYDSRFNEISAFLWTRGHGYDLNKLVAPSDFHIISADYINNHGEIFGHGVYTSGPHAGDARVFVLIRNQSMALPAAAKAARPLPTTNKRNAITLAVRIAHRDRIATPMPQLALSRTP